MYRQFENATGNEITGFLQQMEAMYDRLGHLYSRINASTTPRVDILPDAFKELGFAAEELQVATEELHQQNEQMSLHLQAAATETQYYQALFDQAGTAQLVTTLEGKILAANQSTVRLLKATDSGVLNRLLVNFMPLHHRTVFRSQLNRIQQVERSLIWLGQMQSQQGDLLEMLFSATAVRLPDQPQSIIHWTLQEANQLQAAMAHPLLPAIEPSQNGAAQPDSFSHLESYSTSSYERGDVIPLKPQFVWLVKQGLVKINTLTTNNEEVVLGLLGPGMPLTVGSSAMLTYQATAMSPVQLVSVSITEAQSQPKLNQILLTRFHQRLQHTEALFNVTGQRRVNDRLYHLLRLLKQEIGQPIEEGMRLEVRFTHEELAGLCCTTRVTMTRILGELQQQGKIQFDRKFHIILTDSF